MKSRYSILSFLFFIFFTVKCNALVIDTSWVDDEHIAYNVLALDTNSTELVSCDTDTGCHIGVGFILKSEAKAGVSVDQSYFVQGKTVGEIEKNMLNQIGGLPFSGVATFQVRDGHTNPEDYCITIVDIVGPEAETNYRTLGSSVCRDLSPVNVSCSVSPSEININHGEVTMDQVDGHTATENATITCSQKSNVKMYFQNTDGTITLDNGDEKNTSLKSTGEITSSIKINDGNVTNSSVLLSDVDDSGYNINITSTLHSSGTISTGSYSGSAVFVLSPE